MKNTPDRDFILHVDINGYYAGVEMVYHPQYRGMPLAVCGDPEARHGIILTKNQLAKEKGVKTAQAIWEAKRLCPNLVTVPADHALYERFTRRIRSILYELSDEVEPYGLDEAWVKIRARDYDEAREIADGIRHRITRELGLTASVGVSWTKIFAKLGSDYKKPDATTVITPENYKQIVWTLPAGDLLFVGASTAQKLAASGIRTIGDIANADDIRLKQLLGVNGAMFKINAMGASADPVAHKDNPFKGKSISNSITPPHDIMTLDDAKCLIYLLVECIGNRMRTAGFRCRCVGISVRLSDLRGESRQMTLSKPAYSTDVIAKSAYQLFETSYANKLPIRSMGVSCTRLEPADQPAQLALFPDPEEEWVKKREKLDLVIDDLYARFGRCVERGIVKFDTQYAKGDPQHHVNPSPGYHVG